MENFVAIDFETANECCCSVCSVGIVVVKNGQVVDSLYSLIKPEPNYYKWFCQNVHGLGHNDTDYAPIFPIVWKNVEQKIREYYPEFNVPFVAHNSRFDEGCLKAVFQTYQMDYPNYQFYDTLCAARRHFGKNLPNHQLHTVSAACGYNLKNHHHALADAEACAMIAMKILEIK